jgi:hypothetical protein
MLLKTKGANTVETALASIAEKLAKEGKEKMEKTASVQSAPAAAPVQAEPADEFKSAEIASGPVTKLASIGSTPAPEQKKEDYDPAEIARGPISQLAAKNDKVVDEDKFVRCKEHVKDSNPGANEYAICTDSLGGQPESYHKGGEGHKEHEERKEASFDYVSWVKSNCKFAQAMPQQPAMQQQVGGREMIVRDLASKLVPMSVKFPISDMDIRQGVIKLMREKGLGMPQQGDIESFVMDVKDAIVGMGGQVAQPSAPVAPQAPDAQKWDTRSTPRQQNAPMDPGMQNWYQQNQAKMPATPAMAPQRVPGRKPFEG